MTAALISGDTRFLEAPMRRTSSGLVLGTVLGVLIVLGVVVFTLITAHKTTVAPAAPSVTAPTTAVRSSAVSHQQVPSGPTTAQKG